MNGKKVLAAGSLLVAAAFLAGCAQIAYPPAEETVTQVNPPAEKAPAAPICVDSDNGKNAGTAGFVAGQCADCPAGTIGGNEDACTQDNAVMEFYCTPSGWAREIIQCANGCEAGKCK